MRDPSTEALRLAAAMLDAPTPALNRFLYGFGRVPLSPTFEATFATNTAVSRAVWSAAGTDAPERDGWRIRPAARGYEGWSIYARPRSGSRPSHPGLTFKLYVGVALNHLPTAAALLLSELARSPCACFKVPRFAPDLLRPDRLIAYFSSRTDAMSVAERLVPRLDALEEHVVPFAPRALAGAPIFWGVDRPGPRGGTLEKSWRGFVCGTVARAMTAAGAATAGDRLRRAHQHLEAAGVTPSTWEPSCELLTSPEADAVVRRHE